MRAPDVMGTLRGYRRWLVSDEGELKPASLISNFRWRSGENRAECVYGRSHVAPSMSCDCGFWICWRATDLRVTAWNNLGAVTGVAEGYGRLVLHGPEHGFRAEKAKIIALHGGWLPGRRKWLQMKYPDVRVYRSRLLMVARNRNTDTKKLHRELCGREPLLDRVMRHLLLVVGTAFLLITLFASVL